MKKRVRARKRDRGFTLVELLLVITIIGILAGAVVVRFRGVAGQAKVNQTKTDIAAMELAIEMFEIDTGDIPSSEDGLDSLIEDPGIDNWKQGGYLKRKNLNDPWGNPYIYTTAAERGADFDLYSMGPDEQEGTEDDIGNWDDEDS